MRNEEDLVSGDEVALVDGGGVVVEELLAMGGVVAGEEAELGPDLQGALWELGDGPRLGRPWRVDRVAAELLKATRLHICEAKEQCNKGRLEQTNRRT